MKKIILLAVFAICSLFTKGQIQTFDSLSFTTEKEAYVQLRGKTKGIYWGKIDSIYVKVYIGNNAVYGNYHLRGNFQINLPIDRKITLEILRKGFYPKRIIVNTALPKQEAKPYFLIFDFFMIEKRSLKGLDDFVLDFPTGLVEYNSQKRNFVYAEKYTDKMFKEINKLLEEAEKRERKEKNQAKAEAKN